MFECVTMALVEELFGKHCRICRVQTEGVLIFSEEGKKHCLVEKILKYLYIRVTEDDVLPKIICELCKCKLEGISNFASMAAQNQMKLLDSWNRRDEKSDLNSLLANDKTIPHDAADDQSWWSHDESSESHDEGSSTESSVDREPESNRSLLQSILTNVASAVSNDVTEMEVTVDPMLFFEEDEDEGGIKDVDTLILPDPTISNVPSSQQPSDLLKPYQCYLCPRGFNSDLGLKSHLWNHVPSRKILASSDLNSCKQRMFNSQCLCQVCGRVYPSKSTLRAHQITHSNVRPHKCSLCEKTFKRNQDLKFHINQHTGERPYRCPYCPKAFASSGNCFSHRKRMHPKQLARDKNKEKL